MTMTNEMYGSLLPKAAAQNAVVVLTLTNDSILRGAVTGLPAVYEVNAAQNPFVVLSNDGKQIRIPVSQIADVQLFINLVHPLIKASLQSGLDLRIKLNGGRQVQGQVLQVDALGEVNDYESPKI